MAPIDVFSLFVLIVIIATVVGVFVLLGVMPGRIARERNHPQAQAIGVASWAALIFGAAGWPIVLTWAYLRPVVRPLPEDEPADRVAEMERRIAELEVELAKSSEGQAS